jgi:hypothetical protein
MRIRWAVLAVAALGAVGLTGAGQDRGEKKVDTRVFELRTYYAAPGKMEALHARFRDHTCRLV